MAYFCRLVNLATLIQFLTLSLYSNSSFEIILDLYNTMAVTLYFSFNVNKKANGKFS